MKGSTGAVRTCVRCGYVNERVAREPWLSSVTCALGLGTLFMRALRTPWQSRRALLPCLLPRSSRRPLSTAMAAEQRPWLVVLGPTGVGKTKLSLQLAQRFNGEIINTDAIQVRKLSPRRRPCGCVCVCVCVCVCGEGREERDIAFSLSSFSSLSLLALLPPTVNASLSHSRLMPMPAVFPSLLSCPSFLPFAPLFPSASPQPSPPCHR